ncbi:hypothetical protein FNW02_18255 [Komarekiella sp. 'clone 1']|uniref:Lipoprotein n=1 Tax=Komarekiella delphini-convector SJRDD-AB1 TaxID=2593771 RepID=A0AA40SZ32_9NOST|nr:hypothetical protein [Komarekiella delphini-convector]MBD6617720.1 hypothetical protein [Komarekiella delphini-convector SJRDD-AB1]
MMKKLYKTVAIVSAIAALITGCRSAEEYKQLADAGDQYAKAADKVFIEAGDIKIDLTSENLLRKIVTNTPFDQAAYDNNANDAKARLELINELRKHNQLLLQYFSTLLDLAESDTPGRTKKQIDNIANNLEDSGLTLGRLHNPIKKLISEGTKIQLRAEIQGALREELNKRQQTIFKEIAIQEELLDFLGESMKSDLDEIQQLQEYRLVFLPLKETDQIGSINEWIENRKQILTMKYSKIEEIENANKLLGDFKTLFRASLTEEVSSEELKTVLQDANSFLTLVSNKK